MPNTLLSPLAYLVPKGCVDHVTQKATTGTGFIVDLTLSASDAKGVDAVSHRLTDVFVRFDQLHQAGFEQTLENLGATRVWVDILPETLVDIPAAMAVFESSFSRLECIPVTGNYAFLKAWFESGRQTVALKGSESSGFIGVDSIHVLFSAVQEMCGLAHIFVWGGLGTPEAVAAFLGSGAAGVIFESLHWLTDLVGLSETQKKSVRRLRHDTTTVVGLSTGMPWRFFDKGNSSAVRGLTAIADCLRAEAREIAGLQLGREVHEQSLSPLACTFSSEELIPLGPEVAFAKRFEAVYGSEFSAFVRFEEDVRRCVEQAPQALKRFQASSVVHILGVKYPIIQGGMTWITDKFDFAKAVECAGALPTLTLGLRDRRYIDQDFGEIVEKMSGHSYAVNVLLLEENPFRDEQLAWIENVRPPFVTIAAGDPAFIKRFTQLGIRVIYMAPTVGLLRLAAKAGASFVVLEGNEAGGHVGESTTFSLAQAALVLRQESPDLFKDTHVALAGGIHDRKSAFRAAMLGAEAVQMGTAYLATREIVETGALRELYQRLVIESVPGSTVLSGESIGLRIRSLKTPRVEDICSMERQFVAQGVGESERRKELEKISVGTLFVAARGLNRMDGTRLDDDYCLRQGQFMSGAVAGNLSHVMTLAELHAAVATAPFEFVEFPESVGPKTAKEGAEERIAVTGMAAANSLGNSYSEIFEAAIRLESGVSLVPADRWDHSRHLKPGAHVPDVYTGIGAFMNIEISRMDIRVSPQDFRTMADSSKLTLLLARQALEESGLLESGVDRTRVAVITSQNSAESASTFKGQMINVYAEDIVDQVASVVPMSEEQRSRAVGELRKLGLTPDDTTLTGRLNCIAAGHICNQYAFNGPSYSVGAACASSLVAVHCAIMLMRQGVIDAAVVGGGEESLTPGHYYEFSALGSLAGVSGVKRSPSEYSRPFDRNRDGFVLGEGGAVLVIERESVARARGAKSHAYITGIGACTNHEGIVESVSRTQQIAMRASFNDIGYGPENIDLVECHGTSTSQGDREEAHSLAAVYPPASGTVLASFKSQIGHTLGASGITSMIRGIMAMKCGVLPPTLNYEEPDSEIGLENAGFRVLTTPEPWPSPAGHPRRMQVNAFGFGGGSFVVHLEGAEADRSTLWDASTWQPTKTPAGGGEFLSLYGIKGAFGSAKLAMSSVSRCEVDDLLACLKGKDSISSGMVTKLAAKNIFLSREEELGHGVAWCFSGQGGWYVGMGRELYETVPSIRKTLDAFDHAADFDLLEIMFNGPADMLQNTRWQQPVLFVLEYAIAKYFLDAGEKPDAVAGHSLGEFTALCIGGVLSPEDAFSVVCSRGLLMSEAADKVGDPGSMAATDFPSDMLARKLKRYPSVVITNYNSPGQTVLGGPDAELEKLAVEIKEQGFRTAKLKVSMAFHSDIMAVVRNDFSKVLDGVTFHAPKIPVISNVTGEVHSQEPAEIVRTMIDHLESPVQWTQDVYTLWEEFAVRNFLEIGPSDTLCALVGEIFPKSDCRPTCSKGNERGHLMKGAAWLLAKSDRPVQEMIDLSPTKAPVEHRVAAKSTGMASQSILDQVIEIIMDSTGYERDEIEPDMDIRQDLNIRSSRLPVITDAAEQVFELEFRIEDFIGVETIRDLANRIAERKGVFPETVPVLASDSESDDVLEQVIGIIMDSTGYERDEIEPDMDIRQDLNIRSSRLPVIMDEAEQVFGLEFRIEDFISVETIRDLADRIGALTNGIPAGRVVNLPETGEILEAAGSEPVKDALPVLRYEFTEEPVPLCNGSSAFEAGGAPVAIVSVCDSAYREQARAWVRSQVGAEVIEFDLEDVALERIGACQGLIFILDSDSTLTIVEYLGKIFAAMKALAVNRNKRFCMAVLPAPGPGGNLGEIGEGVLGMMLAGAMEYESTTFRVVALEEKIDFEQALNRAILSGKTVELFFRKSGVMTREPRAVPFQPAAIESVVCPGSVVLFTGGGRGITAAFARSFGELGVRLALLGRSPEQSPDVSVTMRALRDVGCEALYCVCDVADPDAVEKGVAQVVAAYGCVDAVVHGAGVIKDAFLQLMPLEDFKLVLNVKFQGLKNVVQSTRNHGLKAVVAFSSVAAWHGNVGQASYCAANRAMAAYITGLGEQGLTGKTLWLPPIDGVGMANDPEVKKMLARKGMGEAYVPVTELAQLVRLEIVAGGSGWTLFSRPVEVPFGGKRFPAPEGEGRFGRIVSDFPLLDEVLSLELRQPSMIVGKTLTHSRDSWLPDHKPYASLKYPLFSAVMAVETFMEAARALSPDLFPIGVRNVQFMDMIPCAEGSERQLRTTVTSVGSSSAVKAVLACRDISPKGRQLDRWSDCFEGEVLMAPTLSPLSMPEFGGPDSLPPVSLGSAQVEAIYEKYTAQRNRYRVIKEITGADEHGISGVMVYNDEHDFSAERAVYQYSPYVLEALMQLVLFHPLAVGRELSAFLPVGIGNMAFARRCNSGERLILKARLRELQDHAAIWDAVACDRQGDVVMVVNGLSMQRMQD